MRNPHPTNFDITRIRQGLYRTPERYVFNFDRRAFAEHAHDLLKPKDELCPYGLIVRDIFQCNGKESEEYRIAFHSNRR